MDEQSRIQIRKLLKQFGIAADEAVTAHLEQGLSGPLKLKLVIEDQTDYGDSPPEKPLSVEIQGTISTDS